MLAETPVTQHSPCYSTVSSLMNPLPHCSNYLPFCHTHYVILRIHRYMLRGPNVADHLPSFCGWLPLYQAAPLETIHCCNSTLLQNESSRKLMSLEEYHSALRKLNNKQRQVVVFLILLFKLSSQFPLVSFSFLSIHILSLLPFLILSLLPFLISPSLSTIPSFCSRSS